MLVVEQKRILHFQMVHYFFFYFQGDLRRPAALQAVHIRFLRHHSHNALCGTPFGIDIPTIGQANQSFKLHS